MYEVLEGKNIWLRKARAEDYQSMLKHVWGDEAVYRWMLYQPTLTEEDAIERCRRSMEFQKDHYAYFVALKDTDEAVGLCAIKETAPGHYEESGICIGTAFQGKGYVCWGMMGLHTTSVPASANGRQMRLATSNA